MVELAGTLSTRWPRNGIARDGHWQRLSARAVNARWVPGKAPVGDRAIHVAQPALEGACNHYDIGVANFDVHVPQGDELPNGDTTDGATKIYDDRRQ